MKLQGGCFRLFWAILGLFWAPGSPSNHLILHPELRQAEQHQQQHQKEVKLRILIALCLPIALARKRCRVTLGASFEGT